MPIRTVNASLLALLLLSAAPGALAAETPPAFTIRDPEITESSGLQASARHPGVYWTHNDNSADGGSAPYLYAIDGASGETLATITLTGVEARDLEAISIGPEGDLHVGDIGDNYGGQWTEVWIYTFPEPEQLVDATVTPTVHTVQYEDGPRDAEALMVQPVTGRAYIASKMQDGGAALYAAPEAGLSESGVNTFERVADIGLWATDGAFSPDGTRLFLRGYLSEQMFRWEGGTPVPIEREVPLPLQEQGESVTFAPDGGAVLVGSEGSQSVVEPIELHGELRPDSAPAEDDDEGGAGEEAGEDPGDREGANGASGDDGDGLSTGTGATVVIGILVILALGRLLSRRRAKTTDG